MRNIYAMLGAMIVQLTITGGVFAQSFTNSAPLITQTFNSGGCVGVTDMDGDGLDDVMILDQSRFLYVAYQETNGKRIDFDDYKIVKELLNSMGK